MHRARFELASSRRLVLNHSTRLLACLLPAVTMYVSDADGDEFEEVCLPVNLEDDGYNMIHTHDQNAAFILAGGPGRQSGRQTAGSGGRHPGAKARG